MVLYVVPLSGEYSQLRTRVRQLKFRMFLTELRGYLCLCCGFSFVYHWLCLSSCLDTSNSKVIFGKAPFGSLTADVWGYMCFSCGPGPARLTECLLSGRLNRCLSTYAVFAADQQKACIFGNPLSCLYCDVRFGSHFSFNTDEKWFHFKNF